MLIFWKPRRYILEEMGGTFPNDVPIASGPMALALQNPLILEHILQYCSVKDLKKCRRVCRFWRDSCRKSWKSSSVKEIYRNERMVQFVTFLESQESDALNNHHVFNFSLETINFGENVECLNNFWKLLGPQIKFLRLLECTFPCIESVRKVIFKYCPNLEHLYMDSVRFVDDYEYDSKTAEGEWQEPEFGENCNLKCLSTDTYFKFNTGITWTELFCHFPSLENLKLVGDVPCFVNYDEMFGAINTIRRHDPSKLNLMEIFAMRESHKNVSPPIPDSLFQLLLDTGLHLKKLSLNLNSDDNASRLSQIINQHGKSLTMLELSGRRCKNILNPNECFLSSSLETLEELGLHFQMFTSLDVLKFTPNLKKLTLFDTPTSIANGEMVPPITKLEKCVALDVRNLLTREQLTRIINVVPNVERLRMPLDNDTFELVCENWTQLVSLEILDCDMDDAGFTGIDAETVNWINKPQADFIPSKDARRRANITDLKYLQKLYFFYVDKTPHHPPMTYRHLFPLKYCAAQYGVNQLPNLMHFNIENYDILKLARVWDDLMLDYEWNFGSIEKDFIRRDLLDY